MDMLSLHTLADYQSFKPDNWGIPTIPSDSISARRNCLEDEDSGLDLIVMPGVAFDEGFKRLGHGKGYYDYFLARYEQVLNRDGVKRKGRMPILGSFIPISHAGYTLRMLTYCSCPYAERAII